MPDEHEICSLFEVDHVPFVFPDAGHPLVRAMASQKPRHPPLHVLEENDLEENKDDPYENQLLHFKIALVLLMVGSFNMVHTF